MLRNEKGGILLFQTRLLIQFLFVSVGLLVSSWVHKDVILAGCVLAVWVAIGIAYLQFTWTDEWLIIENSILL